MKKFQQSLFGLVLFMGLALEAYQSSEDVNFEKKTYIGGMEIPYDAVVEGILEENAIPFSDSVFLEIRNVRPVRFGREFDWAHLSANIDSFSKDSGGSHENTYRCTFWAKSYKGGIVTSFSHFDCRSLAVLLGF